MISLQNKRAVILLRIAMLFLSIQTISGSGIGQVTNVIVPTIHPQEFQRSLLPVGQWHHRPKVGVVLSGGGGRGLAQIGVIRALEKNNIPIDLIVGNSFGSIIGALYASGYTTNEIESLAIHTNWTELLSFSEETNRTDLFVGQKQSQQEGYFSIRFDGLEPIIPSSISGGQRLSNYFSYLTLQALYHPNPGFDDLKIPFRTIATDIVSGRRIILDHGSLSEAMRASITVPLLYAPIVRDSMFMVDGGLTSNIPVDVARNAGCDLIIAVNSTSSMRNIDQLKAPWEIADQIMTIMMQESNKQQLKNADIVITPVSVDRIVSDFSGIDSLILAGELSAAEKMPQVDSLLSALRKKNDPHGPDRTVLTEVRVGSGLVDPVLLKEISEEAQAGYLTDDRIQAWINLLYKTGNYQTISAEITVADTNREVCFRNDVPRIINDVQFTGNTIIETDSIRQEAVKLIGKQFGSNDITNVFENILRIYRRYGYSLARIDSIRMNAATRTFEFTISEGRLKGIDYDGNEKTRSYIIRREFPLEVNDVFNIDRAAQGLVNIKSTGLFEYVLMDVKYQGSDPSVILKVKERSSELMRLGFHADDEHGIVGTVDIRDANFRGAGEDLGIVSRFGYRDRSAQLEYTVNRIFHSYFTFNLRGYYKSQDINTFRDDPEASLRYWQRIESGKYREIKAGGSLAFGSHFRRFGDVTAELRFENQRLNSLSGDGPTIKPYRFASIKLQSIIDTEDKFWFPTKGVMLSVMFESASKSLGSDVGFGKVGAMYENYFTVLNRHTVRAKVTFGFADNTLPVAEQFSLGGMNSFLGLREDDSRGRQLFLLNFEYRFRFPFKILFETYLKLRCDIGTISLEPRELKFSNFYYGVGPELAIDTPIGPASFALGKSFYFRQSLPNTPVAFGPVVFYFKIGPRL